MAKSKIVRYHSEGPGDRRDLVSFIRTRAILIHLLAEQDQNLQPLQDTPPMTAEPAAEGLVKVLPLYSKRVLPSCSTTVQVCACFL